MTLPRPARVGLTILGAAVAVDVALWAVDRRQRARMRARR